ncbi:GntR family transcriptional regulator [Longimycelium tulufanense]|nr:GntR family transcriptional regulator [Longimycelium tulufanense]
MNRIAFDIDRSSPVPLYFQVSQQIERAITDGTLQPGDRLTNEIELADQLGLSRPTLRRAIEELVRKGMLIRRRGIGTQVARQRVSRQVELSSLYDDLESSGQQPRTEVLEHCVVDAGAAVAEALELEPGAPVLYLERLRLTSAEPLAIMRNWLPANIVKITRAQLEQQGLYRSLRAHGIYPKMANQRIGALSAKANEARLLQVSRGAPLLSMTRTTYNTESTPIEYAQHVYRSDNYVIEVTVVDR